MVCSVAREEGLDAPKLIQHVILLLLYVDDMVIFLYDIDGMQRLLGALEEFCQSSGLTVNVDKQNNGSANHPTKPIPYAYIQQRTCTICTKL